jgi:hypothetical protein
MFSAPTPHFSTFPFTVPLNGLRASTIGSCPGFSAVPSPVAQIQRLRESRPEQPREAVADLEAGILQPARHAVIGPRRPADHDVRSRLQHAEHLTRPCSVQS